MVSNQGFKSATANSIVHEDPDVIAANEQLLAGRRPAARPRTGCRRDPRRRHTRGHPPTAVRRQRHRHRPREQQPALWERYFEIVFSGICTDARATPPATLAASAPTAEELRQLKASSPQG